jgi:hypothetical protein
MFKYLFVLIATVAFTTFLIDKFSNFKVSLPLIFIVTSNTLLTILVVLLVAGCHHSDESCSTIHSYDTQMVDHNGLTLEPSDNMHVSFEQITQIYEDTEACMGMTAPGPTVAFKSFSEQYLGGAWAVYIWTGQLVWVNTDENVAERSCETDIQALQHEFVHHIMRYHGLHEESRNHGTDFFSRCGLGISVRN